MAAGVCGTAHAEPPAPTPVRAAFPDAPSTNNTVVTGRPSPSVVRKRWTTGAACVVSQSPYAGDRTQVRAFPAITYLGDRFFLLGINAGYVLTPDQQPRLSAVAQYRFSPFEAGDSDDLDGMHTRHPTVHAGLKAAWRLPRSFDLELEALTDTLAQDNGQRAGISVGRRFTRGSWTWRPSVSGDGFSANLSRYLYGVGPSEATAQRPAYDPGTTWRAGGGVMLTRTFATSWSATAIVGANVTDSSVGDSPIVARTALWNTVLTVGYRF